jgi:hypothetical protein
MTNPPALIAIAFHQPVVRIRFPFVISQTEFEIHALQSSHRLQYKHTPLVYYKTREALNPIIYGHFASFCNFFRIFDQKTPIFTLKMLNLTKKLTNLTQK